MPLIFACCCCLQVFSWCSFFFRRKLFQSVSNSKILTYFVHFTPIENVCQLDHIGQYVKFTSMCESKKTAATGKAEVVKADRRLFQGLFAAKSFGRTIDLPRILQHELYPYPYYLQIWRVSYITHKSPLSVKLYKQALVLKHYRHLM